MSVGTLGVWLYFMAVRWNTCSRVTYMSAGMLGVWLYCMAVCWHACSGATYMSAECLECNYISCLSTGTLVVGDIYVGWNAWSMVIFHACLLEHL